MKSTCFVFFILVCSSLSLFSQSSWKRTYPQPIVGGLTQTKFFDHLNGYIIAEIPNQTFLYKTNDGTATWINDTAFFGNNGQYLVMNDIKYGWLLTKSGFIMHTADSGHSYILSDPGIHSWYNYSGYATDSMHAWFLAEYDSVVFTQDLGQTWHSVLIDPSITAENIYFLNNQKGWVFTDNGLYVTNDGGFTWAIQSTPPGYNLADMDFADSLNGIAVGYKFPDDGIIMRTIDGGINWFVTDTTQTMLGKINMIDNSHAIAFESDYSYLGNITYSSDTGNTWAAVYSNGLYSKAAQDFTMCDSGICYIVTGVGGILQSSDSGFTWNPISKTINGGQDIDEMIFVDSLNGWILDSYVSGDHKIYKTNDGGVNWQLQNSNLGSAFAPRHFCFVTSDTGWVVGAYTNGWSIAKTVDGGSNYTIQFVNAANLNYIQFNNSYHGIAGGWLGEIFYTFDGGANWLLGTPPVSQNQTIVRSLTVLNDSMAWAIVQRSSSPFDHYIFQTTNGGSTWNIKYHNTSVWERPYRFSFIDDQLGYCIKTSNPDYPNLYKTTDGGSSWVHKPINNLPQHLQKFILIDLHFSDSLNGILVGGSPGSFFNQGSFILKTSDGGNTFNIDYVDTACWPLSNISYIDTSRIYVSGYLGTFISKTGNISNTTQIETINRQNELCLAAFPNPFTNEIKISNTKKNGEIVLFDVSGKVILHEKTKEGQTKLNTEKIATGFYIMRYIEESKIRNIKLTKM